MGSFANVLGSDDLWDVAMFVHTLAPSVVEQRGLRCRAASTPSADEVVGIRTLLQKL